MALFTLTNVMNPANNNQYLKKPPNCYNCCDCYMWGMYFFFKLQLVCNIGIVGIIFFIQFHDGMCLFIILVLPAICFLSVYFYSDITVFYFYINHFYDHIP